MEIIVAFLLLVLFVYAMLLLVYGILKYFHFVSQTKEEKSVERIVNTFKFTFSTKLSEKFTFLNILLIAILISTFIVIIIYLSGS